MMKDVVACLSEFMENHEGFSDQWRTDGGCKGTGLRGSIQGVRGVLYAIEGL